MKPFVPELWAKQILENFERDLVFGAPRMISHNKLEALIANAAEIEGLSDIHEALVELRWRRAQMAKLKKANERSKVQIRDMKSAVRGSSRMTDKIRATMARLKF